MMNKYFFTCGDINGIGPEIVIKTLNEISELADSKFYFACPLKVFTNACNIIKPKFKYSISDNLLGGDKSKVVIIKMSNATQAIGKATGSSGEAAFESIKLGVKLASENKVDAIITAPISKTAINLAGINFPGHTEMLAEWTGTKNFIMAFLSNKMNAALLTIHEPIKRVPFLITQKKIHSSLDEIFRLLEIDLKIKKPRIAVLGLNPHAGENGIIGDEEKNIIIPSLSSYPKSNLISGTFSPDAFFANRLYKGFDLVLGMYHDQVLIPFKFINFGGGVNYTAGLPIVRTSPDHGVAYDIAGKGIADPSSMIQAFKYAKRIVNNRRKNVENH